MVGVSPSYGGGMTEVVKSYAAHGIFEAWGVRYIATYRGRGLVTQVQTWLPALWSMCLLLARRRVALVHVHSAAYGSFWRKSVICALADLFRVPYVFHLHDGRFPLFYTRGCGTLTRIWVRTVLRRAARVIVLTRRWREEVAKVEPAARLTILGNPVFVPEAVTPLRCPARRVLFLAWLNEEKGALDLLKAVPMVLRSVPEATFVLAGAGDIESFADLAQSLGIARAVSFPGWVEGKMKDDLLRQADVFVLPSYFEGLPVGVLEAMARGVPVVATSVGGIPDVLQDGVNGLLVEPGQPQVLGRALVTLLTDDPLRIRLREAAHAEVRNRFSIERVIAELRTLYGELGMQIAPIERKALSTCQ